MEEKKQIDKLPCCEANNTWIKRYDEFLQQQGMAIEKRRQASDLQEALESRLCREKGYNPGCTQ